MPRTRFEPFRHGFHFANGYDNYVAFVIKTMPGRCGGFAYAALDCFTLQRSIPMDIARPGDPDPLASYLYDRNIAAARIFIAIGIQMAGLWDAAARFNESLIPGDGRAAKLMDFIDRSQPFQLGLIDDGLAGHQVLCIGYELQGTAVVPIVYDSNAPDVVSSLRPNFADKSYAMTRPDATTDGHRWVTFVVDEGYAPAVPPNLLYSTGWSACHKCGALVQAAASCPAGGNHETTFRSLTNGVGRITAAPANAATLMARLRPRSTTFAHPINRPYAGGTGAEANWWACAKCAVTFHDVAGTPRACPGGGKHTRRTTEQFTLSHETGTSGIGGWKKCSKCQSLAKGGSCAGGGQHSLEGGQYGLIGV